MGFEVLIHGRMTWVNIEKPAPQDMEAFAQAIDDELCRRSADYAVKRRGDIGLARVEVIRVPAGTFHKWMKQQGRLGGQHKVPRCTNDRYHIEAVLCLAGLQSASRPVESGSND